MTTLSPIAERRDTIDRRLEVALGSVDDSSLALATSTIDSYSDRWYGQLVTLSYAAIADQPITDAVLSASAAVELLRGYCQLRSELFNRPHASLSNPLTRDPANMLLAGDYLNSTAYTVFCQADNQQFEDALKAIIEVSKLLIDAFNTTQTQSIDACTFLDETVGCLGEGAAIIGAKLAGSNTALDENFGNLGRSLSSAYQARRILELADRNFVSPIEPPRYDESELRQYSECCFRGAMHTLNELPDSIAVEPFRDLSDAHIDQKTGLTRNLIPDRT